jgi:hypothetical protein
MTVRPDNSAAVRLLGAFEKLRKATISFIVSVSLSVRPHGSTRLLLDGFSRNFIFDYVSKIRRENCEKRLTASSYPSVCPSVRPHGSTRLLLDVFSRSFIFDCFENPSRKLRKATISFVVSVSLSVCPHGSTRLLLDGISRNFI